MQAHCQEPLGLCPLLGSQRGKISCRRDRHMAAAGRIDSRRPTWVRLNQLPIDKNPRSVARDADLDISRTDSAPNLGTASWRGLRREHGASHRVELLLGLNRLCRYAHYTKAR